MGINEFKSRLVVLVGAVGIFFLGRSRFYYFTHGRGRMSRIARAFCSGHVARIVHDYEAQLDGIAKDRMSNAAKELYSDDSLAGYGDYDFQKADGKELRFQQRGLIIPFVESEIERLCGDLGRPPRVLEIGTGNGDVIADIAARHPSVEFVGVDLSVKNASNKHFRSNLMFIKGYSLDLLEQRDPAMEADIVFGSSTFCAMVPKEFSAHMRFFSRGRCRSLCFSDPVTGGHAHMNNKFAESRHMSRYMWWHNYAGYLNSHGFDVVHCETVLFQYSWNPTARVALVVGRRAGSANA
jgi:tRNA G46 methylase TrmB